MTVKSDTWPRHPRTLPYPLRSRAEIARQTELRTILEVCEAFDELLPTDEPGDALTLLAPWLRAHGIRERDVRNVI